MKKQLLLLILVLGIGFAGMAQTAPVKRIKASEVTIANQAAYTRQAANDFAKLWKPYEATIKLLREYHKVKPKETEAAIVTIGDAVEAKMRELEKSDK